MRAKILPKTSAPWPFNPVFPGGFRFPDFASTKWLAVALWEISNGDTTRISDAERALASLDWQAVWETIYHTNTQAEFESPMTKTVGLDHYRLPKAGDWVQTLLDPDSFWRDINGWALRWTLEEFDTLHESEFDKPRTDWPSIWQAEQAEHHCRRFHAYQRARYRYHEYMLEKHCPRVLGKVKATAKIPQTGVEARACLVGWLSWQRGFSKHPKVTTFTRRIPRPEHKSERFFFDKERAAPSRRPWRANPDEVGWLILTWPVWNFHEWRWSDIAYAVHWKFRSDGDSNPELRPISSRGNDRIEDEGLSGSERDLREGFLQLLLKHCYDSEAYVSWQRLHRKQSGRDKAIEQLCRRTVGLEIIKRPVGSPNRKVDADKPPLWNLVPLIAV